MVDSRSRGGAYYRRRQCQNGHKYTTFELVARNVFMARSQMINFENQLDVAMAKLRALVDEYER